LEFIGALSVVPSVWVWLFVGAGVIGLLAGVMESLDRDRQRKHFAVMEEAARAQVAVLSRRAPAAHPARSSVPTTSSVGRAMPWGQAAPMGQCSEDQHEI